MKKYTEEEKEKLKQDKELVEEAKNYIKIIKNSILPISDDEIILDIVIQNISLKKLINERLGKYDVLWSEDITDKTLNKWIFYHKYTIRPKDLEINKDIDWKQYISEEELNKRLTNAGLTLFDSVKEVYYEKYDIGMDERDTNIIILRSPEYTWEHLGGREWHYNITEDKLYLHSLN